MLRQMRDPSLISYIRRADIDTVLQRIPEEVCVRLRDVFRSNRSFGVRRLGSVRTRGRRDIDLYSVLPPRVSVSQFITRHQNAIEFGAPARGQWPPWAVRRYLLYDVFLHELGHLQLVKPKARNWKRRFASETLAHDFADYWRRRLFAEKFDHTDPVHNAPTQTEWTLLPVWQRMDKRQRERLSRLVVQGLRDLLLRQLDSLGTFDESQLAFLQSVCNPSPYFHTIQEKLEDIHQELNSMSERSRR